ANRHQHVLRPPVSVNGRIRFGLSEQELRSVDLADRHLGIDVKFAHRLHFPVEKLDSQRAAALPSVYVKNAAPYRELAASLHGGDAFVAVGSEFGRDLRRIGFHARRHDQVTAGKHGGGGGALGENGGRTEDDE